MSRTAWVERAAAGLLALLALAGAALPFAYASRPPFPRDYYAIWGLKARILAGPAPLAAVSSPELRLSHPDYPLLYPLVLWAAGAEGPAGEAARANRVGAVAALLTALACLLSLRSRRLPLLVVLGAVALVAWRPLLTLEGYLSLAEPLLCLLVTCGALLGARALETQRLVPLGLAALAFALAALTKNEGLPPALAFFLVALPSRGPDGRRPARRLWLRRLLAMLPGALLLGGWQALKGAHPAAASEYLRPSALARGAALLGDVRESLRLLSEAALQSPETWALLLGGLALAAAPAAVGPELRRVSAAVAGAHLLALVVAYAVTPFDRAWQVETSAMRLLSVWTPLAVVALARAWGDPRLPDPR